MNRTSSNFFLAAALTAALALPSPAAAQGYGQTPPATAEPAAPEKPAAAPKPTITPYGFVLLNGFFNSGPFGNKDNANQVKPPVAADRDGNFVASARGSRIGFRLDGLDAGLIQAKLSGLAEFDFKGGHFAANSAGWNSFIPRLRLAFIRAEWKAGGGILNVVAGQDWGLLNNVNPNTVTYSVDPVFVQSGNLYRRTPQLKAGWDVKLETVGLGAAVAVLSPADIDTQTTTAVVDNGAGNKSRMPDVEGRVAATLNPGSPVTGTVGVGYHVGKRRYFFTAAGNTIVDKDVDTTLLGVDADLNVTQFVQLKGEYYDNKGVEDGYNGAFPGVFPSNPSATAAPPASLVPVTSTGWWAQATLKPVPVLWLAGGYGSSEATKSKLATATGIRHANNQFHGAVIFLPSKALRLSVELARTESKYTLPVEGNRDATQVSGGAQLFF